MRGHLGLLICRDAAKQNIVGEQEGCQSISYRAASYESQLLRQVADKCWHVGSHETTFFMTAFMRTS